MLAILAHCLCMLIPFGPLLQVYTKYLDIRISVVVHHILKYVHISESITFPVEYTTMNFVLLGTLTNFT